MAFNESTIEEVLQTASGAPEGVLMALHADLKEALYQYRKRMERINRHTEVLETVAAHGYRVSLAAAELNMSREGVYKHLRKSTENANGVDTEAA